MRSLTVRVARWSAYHPWRAIVGWLLFVEVCLGVGIAAGNKAAVAAELGGHLTVTSSLGDGTRILIEVPVAQNGCS